MFGVGGTFWSCGYALEGYFLSFPSQLWNKLLFGPPSAPHHGVQPDPSLKPKQRTDLR